MKRHIPQSEFDAMLVRRHIRKRKEARERGEVAVGIPRRASTPGVGDGLGELLHTRYAVAPCQLCKDLAKKMNAWGPEGCRLHAEEIVDELWSRRGMMKDWRGKLLALAAKTHITDEAAAMIAKPKLRAIVEEAIGMVELTAAAG